MTEGMRVRVEVRIDMMNSAVGYGNMQIREDFQMPVANFTELAGILGRFHELAEKIKQERVDE